jgi:ribosomal protein L37AE/L43A
MSGTWKGAEKPGGNSFETGRELVTLPDCPKCKYGTLEFESEGKWKCIDCGHEVTSLKSRKEK